ncbi:MAG: BrnT family toxin [Treponema sp.]|nr:BrnT family toxin [Treponema sp.]
MYNDVVCKGRFVWNRLKAEANHRKHGIPFERAIEVFDDPFFIEEYDEEHSENEDRYNIVGFVKGIHIIVSFTLRDNLVRVFSARKADTEEEEAYDEHIRRYSGER